jgi:WD40 repeat protein
MVSAPGTVANAARSVAWRPQEDAIAIGTETTPWIAGYVWTGSGYGSKYANPATLPTGLGAAIKFSPDGNQIALAHTNSPFVSAWAWSSGFGSKFANPAVLPLYTGLAIDFSPSGNALATGGGLVTTEYSIGVYAWSSSGFGTKYADPPATPFTQRINGVSFNLDGTAISFAVNNNQMPTYPWSFASGFGTKYADAPSIVAAGFTSVSFTN